MFCNCIRTNLLQNDEKVYEWNLGLVGSLAIMKLLLEYFHPIMFLKGAKSVEMIYE